MVHGRGGRPTAHATKLRICGASHPVGSAPAHAPAASLARFRPAQAFDQNGTSTCFAHARAAYIRMRLAAMGVANPMLPSPLRIARVAYAYEQPGTGPLQDTGAALGDVWASDAVSGILPLGTLAPDGRYSDVTAELLQQRPVLSDDAQAAHNLVVGPQHFDPSEGNFLDWGFSAIDGGARPVEVCLHANPALMNWTAGAAPISDTSGFTDDDWHAMVWFGYAPVINGVATFDGVQVPCLGIPEGTTIAELLNSWGKDAGLNGAYYATCTWLQASAAEGWDWAGGMQDGTVGR